MIKQTAIYEWTTPNGVTRYLISPDEWVEGQSWSPSAPSSNYYTHKPTYPAWVNVLANIPAEYPKVTWIDGLPIARLKTLPEGTVIRPNFSDFEMAISDVQTGHWSDYFVAVVKWPDGSAPIQPEDDPA